MADFTQIIQKINNDINTNGVGAITGAKLNEVLRDMIAAVNAAKTDILPDGALYGGFAWPNEPPTYGDDHRYFYLAFLAGSYPAFYTELTGNILAMFYWLEDAQEWTSNNLTMTPTGIEDLLSSKMDTVELYTQLGFLRFSPYSTYSVGDYVVNEGILYVFTSNHPAGQWDEDDVAEASLVDYITNYVSKQLSGKQDTISDLSTIRSGAAAGATAYQKPSGGIPASDLSTAVQTSLGKADTAVQQVTVGTTTTGVAGTNASVTNSGTVTNPVLDFTIPRGADGADGQDAVNPFKGWYASTNALPANPVVGDYAYVKGANASDPAAIYECSTNGTWSDSGRTADTSNVQTFASGEEVNQVRIIGNPSIGGAGNVVNADAIKVLSQRIGSIFTEEAKSLLVNILKKIAYIDDGIEEMIDDLEDEFSSDNPVVVLSATYAQQNLVYPQQPLSVLRDDLIVTATRLDGTIEQVSNYVLSGTLTPGVSVVAVTYLDVTTTFNVNVENAFFSEGERLFSETANNANGNATNVIFKVYNGETLWYTVLPNTPSSGNRKRAVYTFFDLRFGDYFVIGDNIRILVNAEGIANYSGNLFIALQCYNAAFGSDGLANIRNNHSNDVVFDSGWVQATKTSDGFYIDYDTSLITNSPVGFRLTIKAQEGSSDVVWPSSITFNNLIVRKNQ